MNPFTPTTEQVRNAYSYDPEYEYHHPDDVGYHYANRAAFDRWVNKIKAEAWEEGFTLATRNNPNHPHPMAKMNPYRTED